MIVTAIMVVMIEIVAAVFWPVLSAFSCNSLSLPSMLAISSPVLIGQTWILMVI